MCLGIPGEVTALSERDGWPYGSVRFGGVTREVCLACQPDAVPGDFVYVPPHVPHIESNEHSDHEAVVVIARTTQEAIVVNLDSLAGAESATG